MRLFESPAEACTKFAALWKDVPDVPPPVTSRQSPDWHCWYHLGMAQLGLLLSPDNLSRDSNADAAAQTVGSNRATGRALTEALRQRSGTTVEQIGDHR